MEQTFCKDELSCLKGCALFKGCPEDIVQMALADKECSLRTFENGQTVYQPHRFSRCLGILLSGGIRVTRDSLAISVLAPGDLFGAAALYNDREDYATTLTTCVPCRVMLLSQALVSRLMDASPRVRDNYICYLSGRIRFLSGKIQALAADNVEGRLKQYLLTNLSPQQPVLNCTATELAKRLGISRASLYRAFEALEGQRLIVRKGRSVTVPDLKALDAYGV